MMATNWPAGTSKSRPRRISTRWEGVVIDLVSPRTRMAGEGEESRVVAKPYYGIRCGFAL